MLNLHAVIYSLIQGGWLATPSTPPGSAPATTVLLMHLNLMYMLSAELHMNGTVYATLAIRWSQL